MEMVGIYHKISADHLHGQSPQTLCWKCCRGEGLPSVFNKGADLLDGMGTSLKSFLRFGQGSYQRITGHVQGEAGAQAVALFLELLVQCGQTNAGNAVAGSNGKYIGFRTEGHFLDTCKKFPWYIGKIDRKYKTHSVIIRMDMGHYADFPERIQGDRILPALDRAAGRFPDQLFGRFNG